MSMKPYLIIDSDKGRLCCHCKIVKPFSEYGKDVKGGYKGYRRECRDCANATRRKYYHKNKDKVCKRTKALHAERRKDPNFRAKERDRERNRRLQSFYGITLNGYNTMLKAQGGVCAICRKKETAIIKGGIKHLAVDHCHKTGKIRAILCSNCNNILGRADDNIELFKKCIKYLRKHSDVK